MQADKALGRILDLVRKLREQSSWPRAQTRESLRPYLVEEVLELDAAIGGGDPAAIKSELGDLLLHLAFQIVIGEERSEFDAEAIVVALERKMRRRHPHVWEAVPEPETWEKAKAVQRPTSGVLDGLPPTLPPLLMAFRLQERAAGTGFDWPDADGPLAKVQEEVRELLRAREHAAEPQRIEEEIGDLLFAVVNLARKLDVAPTTALDCANRKFHQRFVAMERLAQERGLDLWSLSLADMDQLWNEVKAMA